MPVVAADLTYPTGELRAEWFGDENLAANLTTWLAQGYANAAAVTDPTTQDGIARAYGYWRGYEAKAGEMAGAPNSASVEDLSYSQGQNRKWFEGKAAEWRLTYEGALAAALVVEPDPAISPPVSMSLPLRVSF